jgi:CheY-like chemotaxis protein
MTITIKEPHKNIEILYIEDNPGDALLMKEIFKTSKFPIHLNVARDGEKALDMLEDVSNFPGKDRPDIILLDLNLPGMNGHEVLKEIRKDERSKDIPVLIMSSSHKDQDLLSAYQNQANFYIVKPMDMNHFSVIMTYIENFWLSRLQQ